MNDTPTPPTELVQQWETEGRHQSYPTVTEFIARRAAQWGADKELEACCEAVSHWCGNWHKDIDLPTMLRAARRPKPPSLKEQALALLDDCTDPEGDYLDDNALSIIRRALETLDD
jgi:hypothetical protein